jgi:hypothetical protein
MTDARPRTIPPPSAPPPMVIHGVDESPQQPGLIPALSPAGEPPSSPAPPLEPVLSADHPEVPS